MQLEFRQRLLASTLLIAAAAFAAPAYAQDAVQDADPADPADEVADVGDSAARLCIENPNSPQCAAEGSAIVVTGSRIASPTLTSASPLQIVDAQDIDDSGVVNVQEVLLENPVFGTPFISRTNSNFSTSSAGVASVDLRNLGTARTLLLVNGRRFVAGVPGTTIVDLNTIPTQFIERIDILTGGASSIYGSDAVAGVVNIIYKDDFEGVEASGQIGVSERGDDVRKQANLLMGANFADGRGNVTAHFGYSNEGAVFTRNRERSAVDQISLGLLTGDDEDLFTPQRPFFSSFAPQGTFLLRPSVPGRNLNPCAAATCTAAEIAAGRDSDFTDAGEFAPIAAFNRTIDPITGEFVTVATNGSATRTPTGFNRSAFRTIAIPTERYLIALRGNYEVSDNINAFMEGTFAKTRVQTELEPFALDSSGVNGIFPASGGRFAIETRLPDGTIVRNPLVPDFIFNNAIDTPTIDTNGDGIIDAGDAGDGLRDIGFNRRLADFGNRGFEADRVTYRMLVGLEGDVFTDWRWDVFYAFGETTESQRGSGQVNVLNFRNALNVIPDQFGNPICADAQARAQGCVPVDVFGGPLSISPEAVDFIEAPQSRTTRVTQKLAGANLSGNLFDLWDGPLGFAIGTEYRKESSAANNDALTQAGLNAGNALPSSSGSFDVVEGYAEVVIPILMDRPFFELLQFRGAVRIADYSTVGTTYSWNYGLEYAPIPDIRIRAVQARATRAPNIGELFTPPSQTFPQVTDPCDGVTATTPGTLGTQCRADPGVAANIAMNGAFTLNQADLQGVSGFNRGNPDLFEEKADTLTIGLIVNPTSIDFLRNFALTVDYFDIEIEDAIVGTPRQFALDQCFEQGVQAFCDFITRRPAPEGPNSAGSLEFVDSAQTNSGGLETEGLDVTLSYRQNLENWGLGRGNINARVAYTHIFSASVTPLPGSDPNSFNREVGASRNRATGSLAYNNEDWGVTLRGTYFGPAFLDDSFTGVEAGAEGSELYRIGSEIVTDLQFRFTPGDNYEFYMGVDNLFDNEPPPIITGLPGNTTGAETDASTYDAIGRRYYAGARLKF